MTRKVFLNKLKSRFFLILALIFAVSMIAFTLVACGEEEDSSFTEPTYSKVETDEALVKNGSFTFGLSSLESDDYPHQSMTGWSVATDDSAISSTVSSGIINTEYWDTLLSTLYADSDFKTYLTKKLKEIDSSFDVSVKSAEEVMTFMEEKNFLLSPDTPDGTEDDNILMINNYGSSSRYGAGTAQKATMSDYITLEKGSYGKFTVWVKTANLVSGGASLTDPATTVDECGANIRVVSTFNSSTQKDFSICGIIDTDWTKYEIFVKADADFETKVKLSLGLGYGNGSSVMAEDYTEGTVYFDNITFEDDITEAEFDAIANKTVFEFNAEEQKKVSATGNAFAYTLDITDSIYNASAFDSYPTEYQTLTPLDLSNATYSATESSSGATAKTILGDLNSSEGTPALENANTQLLVQGLKNTSVTLTLDNAGANFVLGKESYNVIVFSYKNQLNRLDKNGITVFVEDTDGSSVKKVTSAATITEQNDEWKKCVVVVKNNFAEVDPDGKYEDAKALQYKLKIVIGPTDVANTANAADYASGDVYFKDFFVFEGKTYQYQRTNYTYNLGEIASYVSTADANKDYKFYNLFSSLASTPVALYAGYSADYSSSTDSYTFNVAPSAFGMIESRPANVKGYTGITPNHVYIKTNGDAEINTNEGAGVINTKYLDAYASTYTDIKERLNHTGEKDIQPVMIYNDTASAYGFVGSSITISANSYAKISVDVKVTEDAKAFVYLADLSGNNKGVLNFSVASNTDGYSYTAVGAEKGGDFSFENITASMMDTTGDKKGWLTLTFYIATGVEAKTVRLELWNGSRDNEVKSEGYVFFNNPSVSTSSAFSEPTSWVNAFTASDSVLTNAAIKDSTIKDEGNYILYKRVLDSVETEYNANQTDSKKLVSYNASIVWAKNSSTVYAIYNTIEPLAVDPNLADAEAEEEEAGCLAETDPSTFWMSFSSILLGVVLVLAILALIIKRVRAKRKANASDAKSHYNVSSRIKAQKDIEKKKKKSKVKSETKFEEEDDEFDEKANEEIEEAEETEETIESEEVEAEEVEVQTSEETVESEPTLDEYVYGEVQDFGEEITTNAPVEEIEPEAETPAEKTEATEKTEEVKTEETVEEKKDNE